MDGTTHRSRRSGTPRPVGQSLWLFATVAIGALILSSIGQKLGALEVNSGDRAYNGAELLELAETNPTTIVVERSLAKVDATDDQTHGHSTGADAESGTEGVVIAGPTAADYAAPTKFVGTTDHETRGLAALDTISYPWQELLPEWTITFLPEKSGLFGLTKVPEKRIEIYVREDQDTNLLAHVIAHELGHAVDVTLNNGSDRRRWVEIRGLDSSPWWPNSGATDFSTGAGDFAESFAAWQVGEEAFRSKLGGAPVAEQIELLAELSAG